MTKELKKELKSKRISNAYKNYKARYKVKERLMKRKGLKMADTLLTKREYLMVRKDMISKGTKQNINQTLVSEQQYEYSLKEAQRFKRTATSFDLGWKEKTVTQLRTGEIDVSSINEALKEQHPEWTGKERASYISYEVFGSN